MTFQSFWANRSWLRVQDEEVTFNVFKAMKLPEASDDVFRVDITDMAITEASSQSDDALDLIKDECTMSDENEAREMAAWMDSFEPNRRKYYEALGTGPSCTRPSIE